MKNLEKLKNIGIELRKNSKGKLKVYLNGKRQKLLCCLIGKTGETRKKFESAEVSKSGNFLYLTYRGVQYAFWTVFKDGRKLLPEPQPDPFEMNEFTSAGSLHLNGKD